MFLSFSLVWLRSLALSFSENKSCCSPSFSFGQVLDRCYFRSESLFVFYIFIPYPVYLYIFIDFLRPCTVSLYTQGSLGSISLLFLVLFALYIGRIHSPFLYGVFLYNSSFNRERNVGLLLLFYWAQIYFLKMPFLCFSFLEFFSGYCYRCL